MTGPIAGLAAGPAFLALLGPAGTGKTCLLQAVTAALRQRGQPAILVRRGELPFEVVPGTAVLVDEAARMDDGRLAQLAAMRDVLIVLADLPAFAARLGQLARPPAIVPLAPLSAGDMPGFAEAWLACRGVPAGVLTPPAVARLFHHSGGVPRLVAQFLRAALAMGGQIGAEGIGADEVDEVAALRLGGLDAGVVPAPVQDTAGVPGRDLAAADPSAPAIASACTASVPEAAPVPSMGGVRSRPRLRRSGRTAALSALAASLLIAAAATVRHGQHPDGNRGTVLAASEAQLPGGGEASNRRAGSFDGSSGAQPRSVRAPAAAAAAPGQEPVAGSAPPQPAAPAPAAGLSEPGGAGAPARTAVPPALHPGTPAAVPSITVMARPAAAPSAAVPEARRPGQAGGAPGLVLLARAGDTMPALYAKIYRGIRPPPYADVVAANHVPLRPGGIVVFPTPQDGWPER